MFEDRHSDVPLSGEVAQTLVETLREKAQRLAEEEIYRFLLDGEERAVHWSYRELDRRARALAVTLGERAHAGERALLLFAPGLDFIAAFFGCLYAGVIAVPAYPPTSRRTLPRLEAILGDARPALILSSNEILAKARSLFAVMPELGRLDWLATDAAEDPAALEVRAERWRDPGITAETVAFLQYTSGSTALPKGVEVHHSHLIHNQRMIRDGFEQTSESVIVGWLPLYHDMGLIGNVMQPLYLGARCILMSPLAFLKRPLRWLEAVSRYRATTSGGPNFAYELCVRKISPDERQGLDLSSWNVAYNGSEPVRAGTLERFSAAFAECGFRREAFYPCYGLAEATLFVTGGVPREAARIVTVDSAALEQHRVAPPDADAEPEATSHRCLVGCGRTGSDQRLRIVDPQTRQPLAADRVGEIWVAGPSVAQGYWHKPEETERVFAARTAEGEGPFLRTGDLGFLQGDGELVVTGRHKDLIILRGRNHYPQDLELASEASHPAARPGGCAAFAVDVEDEERLVIVQELERHVRADPEEVAAAIRQAVAERHQAHVHAVALIRAGSLAKTSSGKVRRQYTRELFLTDKLKQVGTSVVEMPLAAPASELVDAGPDFNREELRMLVAPQRRTALLGYLRQLTARVARQAPEAIDAAAPLSALGLDSLMAVELRNQVEAELGVALPLADLLQGPSLEELAARLDPLLTALPAAGEELPELAPAGADPTSGLLSYGQRAMWFLQRLAPESSAYNIAAALRVVAQLDVARLRQILDLLARRHSALRTAFRDTPDGPRQEVIAERRVAFTVEDAAPGGAAAIEERVAREVNTPFDLERDALMRVLVLRCAEGEHVVVLVLHHVISDLSSLGVLLSELRTLYELPPERAAQALPPLSLVYSDYVHWQQRLLDSPAGERLWQCWQHRLEGELPVLALPADRPRPPHQSFRGAARGLVLTAELSAGVRAFAEQQETTLYTVLLAAFQVLLARYSGQRDILVGTPAQGRGQADLSRLVGYFVNPVVMRADLRARPSFAELVVAVRETVIEALVHQDYPFALLVERLQPQRDPSRSPIFQAMFSLQQSDALSAADLAAFVLGRGGVKLDFAGLPAESLPFAQRIAQFDLELVAAEKEGQLGFSLLYDTELFDGSTAARLLEHFRLLLEGVVAEPYKDVLALPLVSPAERQVLHCEWNDRTTAADPGRLFHLLFEAQVEKTPDNLALACGAATLTYAELNRRANRLARVLLDNGAAPEVRIAVLAERGLDLATAIVAVFKAGAVYVPLDPRHPEPRIRSTLEQCRSGSLLVAAELAPLAERAAAGLESAPPRLELEALLAEESRGDENLSLTPSSENLAYVIYTSGSTGVPKGAMVVHRGMLNHLEAKIEDLAITACDTVAQNSSQCFDISVWQFLAALLVGGSVRIFPDEVAYDPARLLAEVESAAVTIFETVPSMLRAMLSQMTADSSESGPGFAALRWLIPTGEVLSPELSRQWLERQDKIPLVNAYGPTECSDDVTHAFLRRAPGPDVLRMPIGRPLRNTRLYVLDAAFAPVPTGASGELYVGGRGVGRGYLYDPRRSAEAFRPDPFATDPGGRLYKTGDLGRYLSDGQLEFLGRIDHQVKVRGFRVELEEIEAVLASHPAVREVVVLARQDAFENARLVAYWVANRSVAEISRDGSELRKWVAATLPEYMVPSIFMALQSLPLTPNGKVDRKALPEPEPQQEAADDAAGTLQTPDEELVAKIWSEVLGLPKIGPEEGFFDLGGHSLLATQVVSRIRNLLGVELELRELFENLTVRSLAALVEIRQRQGVEAALPPLVPISRQRDLPLSFSQERLWFLDQLQPGLTAYNMPAALVLRGADRIAVLERALAELARRHETLRTTFRSVDGKPVQVIAPATAESVLGRVDLSALPRSTASSEARRLAAEDADRPFDLSRGPLLRATLVELGGEEDLMLINMHHIISDGWSLQVLIKEISTLYWSFDAGQPSPLAELPVQYADYAAWQRSWFTGELRQRLLAYWRGQLRGVSESLELPMDRPRPPVQTFSGAAVAFTLPAEILAPLNAHARQQTVTLFMWLLAAFQALLHRHSGRRDVLVGSPIANRTRTEVEGLIGFFVNALVLRTGFSADPSFVELLGRVRETTLGAYVHQDLSFEKLVEELQPVRHLSHSPLFQVVFALQDPPFEGLELPGLTLTPLELYRQETAKFDLEVYLWREWRQGEALGGHFIYNTDLFDDTTVRRMAGHFAALLESAVAAPQQPISELSLLTGGEVHQLLSEWNDTASADLREGCLARLFEQQVERTPHAVAVVCGPEMLSYAELDRRAGALAADLRQRGVGPGVVAGIAVERGVDLVVALLAVLKAGGAYVPLDVEYPPQRLARMVRSVSLLVTQGRWAAKLGEAAASASPREAPPVVVLDGEQQASVVLGAAPQRWEVVPEHLIYVLYTSGSTGVPKGSGVYQRSFVNLLGWFLSEFEIGCGDRSFLVSSFSFDLTQKNLYAALLVGGELHLPPPGPYDPLALARAIERQRITLVNATPSAFYPIVEAGGESAFSALGSLREVFLGGEPIAPRRLAPWLASPACHAEVVNTYGPTECTDISAFFRLDPARIQDEAAVPIGRPITNAGLLVLDRHLERCPAGVPGELNIAGVGVGMGYLGAPAQTAERFVPHPWPEAAGERLYRTGDLVRAQPGGEVVFLGRVDHQVKVRGFRIEPEEIEAVLSRHPGVQAAAVVARQDEAGERRLVAYVVPDRARARAVRQWLRLEREERLDEAERYELPNGLMIFHLNRAESDFVYRELFEEDSYFRHGVTLADGDCVFDVGANIGLFDLSVARRWPQARIYAFEPLPPIHRILRLNLEIHAVEAQVFEHGLASAPGTATFEYFPYASILSGRFADAATERETVRTFLLSQLKEGSDRPGEAELDELLDERLKRRSFECPMQTLSQAIAETGVEQIDLLKIDVEKAELDVLEGIGEADWPKIRQVVAEVHDLDGQLGHITRLLERHGLEVVTEQDQILEGTGIYNLYARRPEMSSSRRPRRADHRLEPSWSSWSRLVCDLKADLGGELPEYMVPAAFVPLEELPLTPNGKLDRRALPAPGASRLEEQRAFVAPRTPQEELLATIWAAVLGRSQVGIHDNFFDLGGHSLLVTQLLSRVRRAFGAEMPLTSLFDHPTVERFAAEIEAVRHNRPAVELPPIEPRPRDGRPLALSFAQERLWLVDQLASESSVFNLFQALRLAGPLRIGVFERCFKTIFERHESLRTVIRPRGGEPVQVIETDLELGIPVIDLGALPAPQQEELVERLGMEHSRHRFRLDRGPLLRITLLRLGEVSHVVLVTMHHIVGDDWSTAILQRELTLLYDTFVEQRPSPLPELPVQYADYALWQRQWLTDEFLEPQLEYWKGQLRGELPVLTLKTGRRRPRAMTFRGAHYDFSLGAGLAETVEAISRRQGVTPFMTLLAAYATVLHHCSGQDDIIVGGPVANRNRMEIEGLIGFFVNILPLRIDLSGQPSYRELLERIRRVCLEAYDHQDLPFERLVQALQLGRDLSHTPIRQVGFSFLKTSLAATELNHGITVSPFPIDTGTAPLDLGLILWQDGSELQGTLEYSLELLDEPMIVRFVDSLEEVLADMSTDLERPLITVSPLVAHPEPAPAVREAPQEDVSRLSENQSLYYFAEKLQEDFYYSHVRVLFEISGDLDQEAFSQAFDKLIEASDSLRSTIFEDGGVPYRRVLPELDEPLTHIDLSSRSDPAAAFDPWLEERCRQPTDFSRLIDCVLVKMAPKRFIWFFSAHHIILDAFSLEILFRSVSQSYASILEGRPAEVDPMPSYREYVEFEETYQASERYERAKRYWQEKLATEIDPVPFYRKSAEETSEAVRRSVSLSDGESRRLRELTARESLYSISVLPFAVLVTYLYRLTGHRHLRIGTTFANRSDRFRNLIGLLINNCPLQLDIEASDSFGSLARKVQVETIRTGKYQQYPVRNFYKEKTHDIYFNYNAAQFGEFCGMPVHFDLLFSGATNNSLDVQLKDFDATGCWSLDFDFNRAAFEEADMQRSMGHFMNLLGACLQDPAERITTASLLSLSELRQLDSMTVAERMPEEPCLHQLFAAQAARSPEATAVVCGDERLSYRELDQRSNRLAQCLCRLGVGPEKRVGLLVERSLDTVLGILGILKAGGACLPLDPADPAPRLALMLDDARVVVLLTQEELRSSVPTAVEDSIRVLYLDSGWEELSQRHDDTVTAAAPQAVHPEHLACVIYTSDATGKPKGTLVSHRNVSRLFASTHSWATPGDRDVWTLSHSCALDLSIWEIWGALLHGGRVVVVPYRVSRSPDDLYNLLVDEKVTVLSQTPSAFQQLIRSDQRIAEESSPELKLRLVVFGGEALEPGTLAPWFKRHGDRLPQLVNMYGITEVTVHVTHYLLGREDTAGGTSSIGRPIADLRIHLLDGHMNRLPIGIPGEIHVGGEGVSQGYLHRPGLTAQRFVPDPFASYPGGRLYRTGDLARYQPYGDLIFLGRIDRQVRIRGFRIELGEIEALIAHHDEVGQVVVTDWRDASGNTRLAAYMTAAGAAPAASELRQHTAARLPEYMVPAVWVVLDTLPLTPSGKIDRRALPEPDLETGAAVAEKHAEPATPLENLLASVFAEVLEVETVSTRASFFDLGGNSLMATRLVIMLQDILPLKLELRNVFESPTVAAIAAQIEESRPALSSEERELMDEILADFVRLSEDDGEEEEEQEEEVLIY